MKRNPYNIVFLISLVIGSLGLLVSLVRAQSPDCPGSISPYGRIANVRPQPNLTVSPVATLVSRNTLPSYPAVRGWYPLCKGNYIAESVARYMTNTPVPTLRATPTRIAVQLIYCSSAPILTQLEGRLWRVECAYR